MDPTESSRPFPSVPTADTERRSTLTQNRGWSPTELALFGHSISVDVVTGNLLIATADVGYPYYGVRFGVGRAYDAQEQHMQASYLRRVPNVDPKPHWFGNWRFAHEADVDHVWRKTYPEIHATSGLGINGLFQIAGPDFVRNIRSARELQDVLRKYGLPGRTLTALDWAFATNDFVLRTLRGPFQVLTGRFFEETLVDPMFAQLWCFNPTTGLGYKITSDYFYNIASSGYRDVGFPSTVSKLIDAVGHGVTLAPSTAAPHKSFTLSDDSGRQLSFKLDAAFTYPDGSKAGRLVRRYLVSEVTDDTKSRHNQFQYHYTPGGLLEEVVYPSSLGNLSVRYHYDSREFPDVLTSIENYKGDRVTFEYRTDAPDNDDRLNPRLKVARITDPEGVTFGFDYLHGRSEAVVTVSQSGVVDRRLRYEYIRDSYNTKQRFITVNEVEASRGYALDPAGAPTAATAPQRIRNRIVYTADGRFNVGRRIDPLDRETKFEYNEFNQTTRVIDVDNHWTENTYDIPGAWSTRNPIQYDLVRVEREQLVRTVSTTGQITESVTTATTTYQYGKYDAHTSGDVTDIDVYSTHRAVSTTDPRTKIWRYSYDDAGNFNPLTPTRVTTPLGNTTNRSYNARGEILTVTDPERNVHTYSYSPQGALQSYTDPNGGVVRLIYYPEASWLQEYVDQNSKVAEFKREVDGRIKTVTDAVGDSVDYEYFKNGRVQRIIRHRPPVPSAAQNTASPSLVTPFDNLVTEFVLYPLGGLSSLRNAKGLELVFAFDENGRLYEWYHRGSNAPTAKYVYDAAGQVAHRFDRKGQRVDYTYHNSGQLKSAQYPRWSDGVNQIVGKLIEYKKYDYSGGLLTVADSELPGDAELAYDLAGNVVMRRDPDGFELRFTFDDDNNLTQAADTSGLFTAALVVDSLGRAQTISDSPWLDGSLRWDYHYQRGVGSTRHALSLYQIDLPAVGLTSSFDYDAKRRLVSLNHVRSGNPPTTVYSQALGYRDDDLIEAIKGDDADNFLYDGLKQLVFETNANLTTDYDEVGNRLSRVDLSAGGTPGQNTYDQLNRLTTDVVVPSTFAYDLNGSVASATQPWNPTNFWFDGMGQLRVVSSSQYRISYLYDRMGRLVQRVVETVATGDRDQTSLHYLFSKPIVVDRGNNPFLLLTWGPDGRLLRSRRQGAVVAGTYPNSLFALYDGLGNVVRYVDGQGNKVVQASYDPWGNPSLNDPKGLAGFWGYKNGFLDDILGNILFGARWYSPRIGRWLSEDPAVGSGVELERVESYGNFYTYALNSPVSRIDSTGLEAENPQSEVWKYFGTHMLMAFVEWVGREAGEVLGVGVTVVEGLAAGVELRFLAEEHAGELISGSEQALRLGAEHVSHTTTFISERQKQLYEWEPKSRSLKPVEGRLERLFSELHLGEWYLHRETGRYFYKNELGEWEKW